MAKKETYEMLTFYIKTTDLPSMPSRTHIEINNELKRKELSLDIFFHGCVLC